MASLDRQGNDLLSASVWFLLDNDVHEISNCWRQQAKGCFKTAFEFVSPTRAVFPATIAVFFHWHVTPM
eukprot:5794760-Amphidinium_carterae.1